MAPGHSTTRHALQRYLSSLSLGICPPLIIVLSVDPPLPSARVRQPVPFGKYLLLDRISVGGMAEVFKAKSYGVEGFEKIIAIKRILPTMGEDRDFIKMFIDEAKIAGQLAHANICQIFELGRIDGSHFIAMEYIWGKDLLQIQNRLRKIKQSMPIPMACFAIAKVLEGLDYAHRKRDPLGRPLEIVHRDCSPQNVLVSYEGEVKVIDFGIAKATSRNSRTMAGVLKGKFGYMSPEQVRGLPLDRRSDIFALGTMLYECLTGDRLFQGETDFSTLEKVRNVDIRPPREVNPNIPQAVEAVILKALAKDVEERYQWCSEMLADLQAFLMAQDVVFTAKSLSSWLKDVFSTEIDRERQQLEQYKRVGRDGLIDGVPAADAKVDLLASLGEAGPVEGDPTTLGGPNFDDIEQAAGAAPEVGPAPGSPAARGAVDDEDDAEAFGEEAPTEIFGEINHGASPVAPPPVAARASSPQPPQTRPPRPPPNSRLPTAREPGPPAMAEPGAGGPPGQPRPSQQQPRPGQRPSTPPELGFAPGGQSPQTGLSMPSYANPANAGAPYQQPFGQPHGHGAPTMGPGMQPGQGGPQPLALGTPSHNGPSHNGPPPGNAGRTLLGASPPPGMPNYAQGYPQPSGAYPSGPYPGYPGMPPGQMGQMGQMGPPPGQQMGPQMGHMGQMGPQMGQMGQMGHTGQMGPQMGHTGQMGPPMGYPVAPFTPQSNPYAPHGAHAAPAVPPPEQAVSATGARRSSIARDVAIGVAIAALVLGGFLAVKFLILDRDTPVRTTAGIAEIKVALAPGVVGELYVDETKVATVRETQTISVTAGTRKVRLVGLNGGRCEQEMKLAAGKIETFECAMAVTPGAGVGAGSADPSAGSGSGSAPDAKVVDDKAAADGKPVDGKPAEDKALEGITVDSPVPDKNDRMPIEDKPADKVVTQPPEKAADKSVDKPAAAVDKAADRSADKPADKVAVKPPEKAADKPAQPATVKTTERVPPKPDRPVDKPRTPDRPARGAAEDDPLGQLKGGVKPGDARPADAKPAAGARVEDKGFLTVTSRRTARISIDGIDTGSSTPLSGRALPPGKHKVTFAFDTDKHTFTVVIKAGETTTLHKDL
jgi:serine/threonine protein kinase